ncbi:MAG: hypothetical protein PHN39_02955 [Candidatus Pacebacteria bacterium]|nr:hypothetical protein [Candidatus Paceibacterota bacterium]
MLEEIKDGVYQIFFLDEEEEFYGIRCEKSKFTKKLNAYSLILIWRVAFIDLTIVKAIAVAFKGRDDVLIVIPKTLANAMMQIPKALGLSFPSLEVCSEAELAA